MSASTSIGPISGIDYGKLITGLTQPDQAQIDAITTRTDTLDGQSQALNSLASLLTGLNLSAAAFTSSTVFKASTATSSNPPVLSATTGVGVPVGNYNFTVQRLASASQIVTQGFSDPSTTALGLTGNLQLQLGGGDLTSAAKLATLNGGAGVARGSIRISDGSGASTLIDLSDAVDINDVVNAINSTTGVNISASVKDDHLVLTDNSGGAGNITVSNAGGTTTASDLGLVGTGSSGTLVGTSITNLSGATSLDSLNDGLGVRGAGVINDFSITGASGTAVNVSLGGAKTVADVISKINTAGQAQGISAAISADGHGITLSDTNGGPLSVAALNGSDAAYDLGILGTGAGGTLVGDDVTSGLDSPLLRNLNGGYEGPSSTVPQFGTIAINGTSVDLSGARTLNDVLQTINGSGTGVTAALDSTGTGITLSSAAASFTVADGTGNLASFLHIAGTSTAAPSGSAIASGDLHNRYVSNNTQLSVLSAGAGFKAGKIKITDGNGASQILDLSGTGVTTVGDVLNKLNSAGLAISARVNDTGDGILITQTAGTLTASIQDADPSVQTAESLGIAGTFSGNQLNGSLEKSISIVAGDTLSQIATKINDANAGVSASIINDGSGTNPYRLAISSKNSGAAGRLVFDGSAIGLQTTSLVQGQDAVLVYGGSASGTGGLVSTSATNTITGLVPSLTLNLTGVGNSSVAVTRDNSQVTTAVQSFVDSYNKVINEVATDTTFNSTDQTKNGVLFGNPIVQQVQQALGAFITKSYSGLGQYQSLASIGISVQQDGTLTLSSDTLNTALATAPDDVRTLFSTNVKAVAPDLTATPPVLGSSAIKGIGATLTDLISQFTDAQTGSIFQATDAITTQETQLKSRQTELATLLLQKRNNLIETFANLETNIASLQQQGSAISSMSTSASNSSSKSSG